MNVTYIILTNKNGSTMAAYNRVAMLSKGLNENGINSKVKTISETPKKNIIIRVVFRINLYLRLFKIFQMGKKGDVIIIYGEFIHFYVLKKFIKKGVKIVIEKTEYSSYVLRDVNPKYLSKIKKFEASLSETSAIITCSSSLKNYYRQFTLPSCKWLIVPFVVDLSKFDCSIHQVPEKYIAYCGDFGNNKDGVPILIDAFHQIAAKYTNYKLYLIGDTTNEEIMNSLKSKVIDYNIENQVVFTGRLPHEKVINLLKNASILALARPENKQAEGGMPSKLVEYLATGNPTLVTKVGEIPLYFEDGKNIYFAEPNSHISFSSKLDYILSNYEKAKIVGLNGSRFVKQFNYLSQGEILKDFLLNL